ncbi:Na+/H+ antiporter NhaD/arsenite permease-like protein [Nocardiopsis arvandica]|uniref:Na+/H+ antiporter NhaD/arsenite permease-like protein n=1 Tax=Nocardiopsis sinuspersici TaxID=501010 RepID=A0A7Y9XGK5_9ACTN|nr:hypothetical protein [Nocardiopsis sinuspersici]NYH55436.1 Na+/H+ antiporter NhaD/arsenite permease-like protein [Nocardiopsis sinuspersici]
MGAFSGSGMVRTVMLGLATGSRGTLGSAPLWTAAGPGKRAAMALAALGEFSGDKIPGIPSRLVLPSLAGRVFSAGTGGALLARSLGAPVALGAVLAAAATPVGAAAGVGWRRYWSGTGRPGWVGGLLEDVCAVALAGAACRGVPVEASEED